MPPTHTTDRILIGSYVLTQRPAGSRHSVWGILIIGICCYRYLLYRTAQNAPYQHHRQNSHWILCLHTASGMLQTVRLGIFNHRYLLLSLSLASERPECLPTPQTEFSSNLVSSRNVRQAPENLFVAFLIIGMCCYRYLLYLNTQNTHYLHYKQNSHRISCPHKVSGQLQTCSMWHF